jgi:ferritin
MHAHHCVVFRLRGATIGGKMSLARRRRASLKTRFSRRRIMLAKALHKQLLDQVKYEWESEFLYLAMMAWCYNNDYEGFAQWFYRQSMEERAHGAMILGYLTELGAEIEIPTVVAPKAKFKDLEEMFDQTLKHEQKVTKLIHDLVEAATKERDYATVQFLQWYVKEQIEEEDTARKILVKIRRGKGAPGFLFMLERELGARGVGLSSAPSASKAD